MCTQYLSWNYNYKDYILIVISREELRVGEININFEYLHSVSEWLKRLTSNRQAHGSIPG